MGWPWTEWEWGPIWMPGIYDDPWNFCTIRFMIIATIMLWLRHRSEMNIRYFYSRKRLDGKLAIVTGGDLPLGKEIIKDLTRRGCRCIIGCSDMKSGSAAKDEILNEVKGASIVIQKLDMSSFRSIREFTKTLLNSQSHLDLLIHAVDYGRVWDKEVNEDGLDMTLTVNHYGPFLLTNLLSDALKKSNSSRIVVITNKLYQFASFATADLKTPSRVPLYTWCQSKNSNIMFTLECSRRIKQSNAKVTINATHAGIINGTGFIKTVEFPSIFSYFSNKINSYLKTAYEGCQMPLFLAVSDEVEGVSGNYYKDMREDKIRDTLRDAKELTLLWEESAQVVKLSKNDPQF